MELVAINSEETLFVSGEIDDWPLVRERGIDTIIDMDGDVDPGIPELRARSSTSTTRSGTRRCPT